MLVPSMLETDLQTLFHQIIPPAIETCMRGTFKTMTKETKDLCKEFADRFDDMVSADLAKRLADIIDKYIKSMCIYGNIITVGAPTTQTAIINPGASLNVTNPVAGKMPNVLGVM